MKVDSYVFWVIVGSAVVTLIPRVLPFLFMRRVRMPVFVQKWLSYIPVCLFSALIVQGVLEQQGRGLLSVVWSDLMALAVSLAVAFKTRSLLVTVLTGVVGAALFRWLF
jgi:branched-subunit amino acid transport protein